MDETICLNKKFSTTRRLSKESPSIEMNVESSLQFKFFLPESGFKIASGGLRTKGYYKAASEDFPLISIVTVVFNGKEFLEETILSVINQNYDNVEYIVIDGGSTDGTLDIIKKYENQIDYWVSEPDKGIYDAMNKGIKYSSGDIVGVINADDYYLPNAFQALVNIMMISKADIFYGRLNVIDRETSIVLKEVGKKQDWKLYIRMCIPHQAAFVKSRLHKETLYLTKFRIASDYYFFLQAKINKKKFKHINFTFAHMRDGGLSDVEVTPRLAEFYEIRKELLGVYRFYLIKLLMVASSKIKKLKSKLL